MSVLLYNSCICVFKYKSILIQSGVYHVQSVTQVLVTITNTCSNFTFGIFHFFGLLTMYERIYGVQEGIVSSRA